MFVRYKNCRERSVCFGSKLTGRLIRRLAQRHQSTSLARLIWGGPPGRMQFSLRREGGPGEGEGSTRAMALTSVSPLQGDEDPLVSAAVPV